MPSDPPRSAPENVTVPFLTYAVPPLTIVISRDPSALSPTSPFASVTTVIPVSYTHLRAHETV